MKTAQASASVPEDVSLVPLPQAARRLGIAYSTAWAKVKQNVLPAVQMKHGGRLFIRSDVLDMLITEGDVRHAE